MNSNYDFSREVGTINNNNVCVKSKYNSSFTGLHKLFEIDYGVWVKSAGNTFVVLSEFFKKWTHFRKLWSEFMIYRTNCRVTQNISIIFNTIGNDCISIYIPNYVISFSEIIERKLHCSIAYVMIGFNISLTEQHKRIYYCIISE